MLSRGTGVPPVLLWTGGTPVPPDSLGERVNQSVAGSLAPWGSGGQGRDRSPETDTRLLLLPHLLEQERPLLVADDNVEQTIAVDILHHELRADARIVVDQVRDKRRHAVGRFLCLEPVERG